MFHRINNGGLAGIYENRNNLFQHLPMQKGSIIFLGDSLTEFGQWEELINHPKIKNRGIAGDTTWGLLRRLKNIIDSKPKAIFLMIGINDFLFIDSEEIIENYKKIISQIKKQTPDCQLFIQSILPVNDAIKNSSFDNLEINLLNDKLKIIAQQEDLIYIDIHEKLLDKKGKLAARFTADGVHINGEAYFIWKEKVNLYLQALLHD